MILDSSAIVAIVLQEPGHEAVRARIERAPAVSIGAPTLVETGILLSARLRRDARGLLARLVEELEIEVLPFGPEHHGGAVGAWLAYGKGRHPAQLNFGDCLVYAVAEAVGEPLLAVGEDFPKTDLELA